MRLVLMLVIFCIIIEHQLFSSIFKLIKYVYSRITRNTAFLFHLHLVLPTNIYHILNIFLLEQISTKKSENFYFSFSLFKGFFFKFYNNGSIMNYVCARVGTKCCSVIFFPPVFSSLSTTADKKAFSTAFSFGICFTPQL